MDLGLLLGLVATWALIVWSLMLGGSLMGYYDFASVVLVFGGSAAVVFITHPHKNVFALIKVSRKALFPLRADLEVLIAQVVGFAETARRDGILSLENKIRSVTDPFMVKAMQMAIDGTDGAVIEQVLTADIDNAAERHDAAKSVIDALGKYAPAMGMIGTLMGLVVMLKNMADPSQIGPGMAVAILTTLYGALISNAICGPLSDRLARRAGEEASIKTIIMQGMLSIQAGDNPRMVEAKLRTYLPGSVRARLEDAKAAA